MKAVKFAYIVLLVLIVSVSFNSYYIKSISQKLVNELEIAENYEDYSALREKFKKAENIISLTVSHDDLANIEEGFAEIIGASKVGEKGSVTIIKSRLIESLEHLGRLSGVNPDSIL